ncbi:MAG: transglycosylase SLT domain-containing protein [Candidatus Eremiobacteraeota bacterium]|nr:transglycosylase SLT domain-containing protein [Candidatus Eremiobacteraeota bacterium]
MPPIQEITGGAGGLAGSGVAFAADIARAAQRHGIDPRLLAAVAAQETGGPGSKCGRNIVGDGGHGRGLFQIDDRWHTFARTSAAMDPAKNAEYAATMISGLVKRFGGDVHKALSAYNAGSGDATGTITTWGDGRRLGYADSVLRHYGELGGSASGASLTKGAALAQQPYNFVQECIAERMIELANINQLQSFALQTPATDQNHSTYRSMAGLDARGQRSDDKSIQILETMIGGDDASDINVKQGV